MMNLAFPKPKKRPKKKRKGMDKKHLENIRKLPCLVCGDVPSEVHHLKQGTGERGMGLRSTDRWAVPLCHAHHINGVEKLASTQEAVWFMSYGIHNPLEIAAELWEARGDPEKMHGIIEKS